MNLLFRLIHFNLTFLQGAGVGYGFAAMSTDTGHNATTGDGSWALGAPEKITDWAWRALHGSVVLAKQLTEAYYGDCLQYSYYTGCSTGGRQGLKEAEMFPDDFDGIVAGAPAWWATHLQPWTVKAGLYNGPAGSPHSIPESMFPVIGDEIVKQCDPQDGVRDTVIQDPHRCRLQLEALLCQGSQTTSCLTAAQLKTLYQIYSPYVDINQTFVHPPLLPGTESQWPVVIGNGTPNPLGTGYMQYFMQLGADWSPDEFGYDIVVQADKLNPGNATADDFDLSPFYRKGGKLLQYHGMSDGYIPTDDSLYFYNHVLETLSPMGIDLDSFFRFFYIPGMQYVSTRRHQNGTELTLMFFFQTLLRHAGQYECPVVHRRSEPGRHALD
jgi:feruloyl esterase